MKLLALALLLAFAANPASAASASLTGKWKVHNSVAGNETDQDCTFTQTDKDLAGICTVEQGTVQVTGKIGDASITWTFKTEYNGSPLTLIYTGTMDKDSKIAGTLEVQPLSVMGDFTAVPEK